MSGKTLRMNIDSTEEKGRNKTLIQPPKCAVYFHKTPASFSKTKMAGRRGT